MKKMRKTESSIWRYRYNEAIIKIIEGRQTIHQTLIEAENLISSGKINLMKDNVRNEIWNEIGEFFFTHGLFSDCERLNKHFLKILNSYDSIFKIPRGGAQYNLGIAQLNQRNFDEGIPNILNALTEDEKTHGKLKASSMRASKVRESFNIFTVSIIEKNFMPIFNKFVKLDTNKKTNTKDLLSILPTDADRFLLTKSINIFHNSSFGSDTYSKVLMFDNLKTVCLILENSLRIKGKGNTLIPLILNVFKNEQWLKYFEKNTQLTRFQDPTKKGALQKFEAQLMKIENKNFANIPTNLSNEEKFLIYAFLKSALLRNLTAHLFDLNASILQKISKYQNAFEIVMLSLLYSLHFQS